MLRILVLVMLATLLGRSQAQAEPSRATLAFVRLEPLGLDTEHALRLEALFRAELERLVGTPFQTVRPWSRPSARTQRFAHVRESLNAWSPSASDSA